MKNGLLIWNLVLTLGCGYLFFAHFSGKNPGNTGKGVIRESKSGAAEKGAFKIAYFEMDSVEASFYLVKDLKSELQRKEEQINAEMSRLSREFQQKYNDYQQQEAAGGMTDEQRAIAGQVLRNMEENSKSRKQTLDGEYSNLYMRGQKELKDKIEVFLNDFNKSKEYAYIVSNDTGLFHYRDSVYNITNEVVKGLNDFYKTKKN